VAKASRACATGSPVRSGLSWPYSTLASTRRRAPPPGRPRAPTVRDRDPKEGKVSSLERRSPQSRVLFDVAWPGSRSVRPGASPLPLRAREGAAPPREFMTISTPCPSVVSKTCRSKSSDGNPMTWRRRAGGGPAFSAPLLPWRRPLLPPLAWPTGWPLRPTPPAAFSWIKDRSSAREGGHS